MFSWQPRLSRTKHGQRSSRRLRTKQMSIWLAVGMIEGQRDACWNFLVNGLWLIHRKNLRDELEAKREELHALATDFHSHLPPDIQNEVTNTPRSFQAVINASEKLRSSWETRSETNKFAKARMPLPIMKNSAKGLRALSLKSTIVSLPSMRKCYITEMTFACNT
ncbi:hypothetical protein MPH_02836 [Macrophomina phaseolina MS6]|uniref:Uncharacterized protein n=1 Tax=Macrophomina phaseolina (strain MS6) TaxID=1126212 RepID=K2SBQ5_MACPH|nr:hypothetical protein MPH_02836 [Macrophomina phaseolina MS6]